MKILILEDGTPASADLNAKLAELGIEVVGYVKTLPSLDALPMEAASNAMPCSRILVPVHDKSLDGIMQSLDSRLFYRANKQYIVSRDVIKELVIWFDSRLLLHLSVTPPEPVYVSKNRAAEFKQWML